VTDDTPVSFVPMAAVNYQDGIISESSARPYGQVRKGFTHFGEGDVLFARITPCMENGKVAVARGLVNGLGCGTTEFHVLRPLGGILSEYIHRYLRQESFRRAAAANMSGTAGQLRVPTDYIKSVELPLAPLAEQRRIVAKVEALFEQSRTARHALDRIPLLLKKFRQSVLAAAFRGDLTRDWREQHPDVEPASLLLECILAERHRSWEENRRAKGKAHKRANCEETSLSETDNLPELPVGWLWCKLQECATLITKGESPKWQGYQYVANGVPFVRSENVLWGSLDLSRTTRIPNAFHQKLRRSQLKPNDVLINLVGASIGRCAIVPPQLLEANINQAVATIRTTEALSPFYLLYLLLSPAMQEVIQGKKVEVARPNISLGDLTGLTMPLAPRDEQQQIVSKISRLFAQAEAIEAAVEVARRQGDKLNQSVLARAFRGDLVPQDPNDEPALVLLKRIRTGNTANLRRAR
jgi:type I restriction enzyme S subunit